MTDFNISLLAAVNSNDALVSFIIYSLAVMALAFASHKILSSRSFMAEYFLGSRNLGVWAFMLTFAATSASAGSFAGFPSLIYTHGWILALWIAGYMVVPLTGMGLLGKRLNRMARQADAITLPELLNARFADHRVSILATLAIVTLLSLYLIPQFKISSIVLKELLSDVPLWKSSTIALDKLTNDLPFLSTANPEYLLGLLVFSVMVIAYTSFGGFRAVVWTDMLQGIVMFFGVMILLWIVLQQVGGLKSASEQMAEMTTPRLANVVFKSTQPTMQADLHIPSETWFIIKDDQGQHLFRTNETAVVNADELESSNIKCVEITSASEKERIFANLNESSEYLLPSDMKPVIADGIKDYPSGAGVKGVYVTAPGPSPEDAAGFMSLSLAVSFFILWTFGGAGQPGNIVRLMAFDGMKTLKWSMALLVFYYGMIYVALIVIFCCARILEPGLDHTPDRIMPVLSLTVSHQAGMPWLAGILIAAPFAAAMSTVDSFMLMISSALVRDVYQREINPDVSEKVVKRLSYLCTVIVGTIVMIGAVNPPKYLQMIIVFTSSGLTSVFFIPVFLAMYWPRFNAPGAIAGMISGFFSCMSLYVAGYVSAYLSGVASFEGVKALHPLSLDPLIWGVIGSAIGSVIVCKQTPPPPREIVQKFFGKQLNQKHSDH